MADFFYEYELSKQCGELEARDRWLQCWGCYLRRDADSAAFGWRFRAGEALIYLGCWPQGGEGRKASGESGNP